MKISKLLSIILGLSGFLRMGIVGEGGGGDLSMFDAGSALAGIDSDEGEGEEETEDAAAERLAAEAEGATQVGDESETEAQAEAGAGEKITIEVDGKTIELDKADLPELYKNGLRQQDYTQKTMAVSEKAKEAAAETAKARADRDHYAQQLNNFAITTNSLLAEQQKVLTLELARDDPVEYQIQKHIFDQRQVELNKANAELQRLEGEYKAEQQREGQQYMEAQRDMLLAANPDLKDEAKQKKFFGEVDTYMTKVGFKPEDARVVYDARVLLMADKAQKYEALMARAKETAGKVKAAPVKVERPGVAQVAPTDGRTQQMKKLASTGSVRDAGALLANLM